ncbi:MAG: alcohol dehydrogenase catalytic domain-containing protein [Vicinamibacterales bacterium]
MRLERIAPIRPGADPLRTADVPPPEAGPGQVRLRVLTCGVCHTELDEIEGRTPPEALPRIPGHQVVGRIDQVGAGADGSWMDRRVGVGWIYSACGQCDFCRRGLENLCADFVATGRDVDGGYAEWMVAPAAFVAPVPDVLPDDLAAPLLCAGAIGFRSLALTGLADGESLGLTGFGASGHLVLRMSRVRYPRSRVFVFARSEAERALAMDLGAAWAGDTAEPAPEPLRAIIDTTPVWTPVVRALDQLAPGGRLVINAIRKEDVDKRVLLDLDYPRQLWLEKSLRSVANVTRDDIRGCLDLAAAHGIRPEVTTLPLEQANQALHDVKRGGGRGARVLVVGG